MTEVLANAMVVIILQYISVSTQTLYTLSLTQCYISITSQWSWKGRECRVTAHKQHRDSKAIYSWLQRKESDFCHSSENSQAKQSHPGKAVNKLPQGPGHLWGKIRCLPPVIDRLLSTNKRRARALNQAKYFSLQFYSWWSLRVLLCTSY